MKLEQGQIWKVDARYFWIVKWERLSIEYKELDDLDFRASAPVQQVTKKEFCRLIKGAELMEEGTRGDR